MGNKTFDVSSKNKDILPKNDQIWRFCSFWVRPCRLIWCPVGGLVGGFSARAVSCKTPIYFMIKRETVFMDIEVSVLYLIPEGLSEVY